MTYSQLMIGTEELTPNPWNSNIVTPDMEQKLDESVHRFGLFKPVVARRLKDGSLQILGGQHRWEAAKRCGIKEVPVFDLGPIDDTRAKEISLVDNGRYGADDASLLADVLKSLDHNEELSAFLPYSVKELEAIYSTNEIDLDELTVPGEEEEIDLSDGPEAQRFHVMRFKVMPEDAEWISALLEKVMKEQGFSKEDALTNAGQALVHVFSTRIK